MQLMDKPLSEIEVEGSGPVFDVDAYVNRSVETRREDLDRPRRRNCGRVPRPCNSFILYRSTYSQRARALIATAHNQPNAKIAHQGISTLVSVSWKMESNMVRERFNALARRE